MAALGCTLVSLCVSLILVSAMPTAKRFDRDDVLAGGDFLSVYLRRGDRLRARHRAPGPFDHYRDHDRELNSVSAKAALLDLVPNKYDIFKTKYHGYEVNEQQDYHEAEQKTTTQFTEPTTTEEELTTVPYAFEKIQTTVPPVEESVTQLETTTPKTETEKIEEKVIEVRVSSSVARHSHRTVETSTTKTITEVIPRAKLVDENLVSTLVTQEQPKIQAVQRSDFVVEEAPLPNAETTHHQDSRGRSLSGQDEVEGKVQEVTRYGVEQPRELRRKLPVFELHFHNPPEALMSSYEGKAEAQRSEGEEPQPINPYRRKEFRQLNPYGRQSEPISYHSRVSSPTSDSSINFYREHHANRAVAETVQQPVISEPYPPATYIQNQDKPDDSIPPSGEQQHQESSTYHEEPSEQVYGEPEKVYGQPEQNYEVDEAVSVITNGKAHGVQAPTSPPAQSQDQNQNKFGYVVEGRNFRKYRVEERTNDGFIVGEYGVVSHDDGSLRGVRYTADSTINPRLIYDTLVKFLSL